MRIPTPTYVAFSFRSTDLWGVNKIIVLKLDADFLSAAPYAIDIYPVAPVPKPFEKRRDGRKK